MKGLRDERFSGMRLLECQIMNEVSFLSGAFRTQHDVNERLMPEASEGFSNFRVLDLPPVDNCDSSGVTGEAPQVPLIEFQDARLPSEQQLLTERERNASQQAAKIFCKKYSAPVERQP